MEYTNLAGTGLNVSRVCLGTMTFSGQLNEQDSIKVIKYALDNGINFIDTADIYNGGQSEIITGKGIKGCRENVILASKVGGPSGSGPNDKGLSRKHIISSVENSLKRLNTDYLDIYYMHAPDPLTPFEETMEAMTSLVKSGKVRYIGISNFAAWQLMDALWTCDKRNLITPSVTENVYNSITRGIESELVPCIKQNKVGLVIYNPIAGGLLSGKHSKDHPVENSRFSDLGGYYQRYWNDDSFQAMEKLTQIAQSHGMKLLELALRWCISYSYVNSVIIGVSRLEHLKQNLAYLEKGPLSNEILSQCDEVWKELHGSRFSYHHNL
ncbi:MULTISPECIES: aldo/keto reductase [Clostridium]|uniref:General stress protein 69 n=3 Tax=Clostridium TaxID=1485 RepID=D8GUA7_CLOLD|nr:MULTISPECIES: aldo/keto reductase [Clostridium]ADK14770.1 predicted aldo/keto reductase [Clostridium ljungdahlii DSM 13528]AGY78020.1 aldo/keto reductase [Clostridium autoethanogenum DSM 10061]ALU38154.1 NADP-dependent oxidoreductase domain-containing protein [Clostridium autoethanogenum DSM 10061]OAA85970.1 General stress protein 69 [Clostridium ljungdahlii DSM 13528]OVY50918.1 General stress protein 69 [Clostridium autoethanogenum]